MEKVFSEPVKDILKTKMEERMKKVFARAELGLRADLLAGPVFWLDGRNMCHINNFHFYVIIYVALYIFIFLLYRCEL